MKNKLKKLVQWENSYTMYSILFLMSIVIIYIPFLFEGKTFVWNVDGISQHFPSLVYYSSLLKGLLMGKGLPMIDLSVGLGFDTISTLHYYVLGDPFSFLAALFPTNCLLFSYQLFIIIRLYCTGLSFISFSHYFKQRGLKVTLGSIIYIFSGYLLFSGVRHPYFINPMIYLPLLMIGCEELFKKKKPTLLILMSFISTISNFYFMYILSLIVVIYCVVRYITCYSREEDKKLVGFFKVGIRIGLYYLLGILMSAFVLFPVVYAFLQNGRMSIKPEMASGMLHYNFEYYKNFVVGFLDPNVVAGYYTQLGFVTISAISIIFIFCKKKYRTLQILFSIAILGLLIPAFGSIMNGGSYVTNRWSFCLGLIIASAFVFSYDSLFIQTKSEKLFILTAGFMYLVFCCVKFRPRRLVEMLLVVLTVAVVLFLGRYNEKKKLDGTKCTFQNYVILILVMISVLLHGYNFYSERLNNYLSEFLTPAEVRAETTGNALVMIDQIEEDGVYRIETFGDSARNEALCLGYYDVSAYFSLLDGNITEHLKELELLNLRTAYRFDNMDTRTILDALYGVKYFVSDVRTAAPYAYKLIANEEKDGKQYYLFENEFALPIGIFYDKYITEETYSALSSLEKQNALLKAVVIEADTTYADLSKADFSKNITKLQVNILPEDGIEVLEDRIVVKQSNASIRLEFQAEDKTEVYVRLENMVHKTNKSSMISLKVKGENEATKYANLRSKYHNTYFGKNDYLINLGYSKKGKSFATITFPQKGTFYYTDLSVFELDMDGYKKQYQKLSKQAATNISVVNNKISCDIDAKRDGIFVLEIPYSSGYKAYVDGKEVPIIKANIMNMGIELSKGEHKLEFQYQTPYFRIGVIVSLLSTLVFLGVVFYHRRQKYLEV